MQHRITFTCGTGFDCNGKPLDDLTKTRAKKAVRTGLASGFGGYSETTGHGGWLDDSGSLVEEQNVTWVVIASSIEHAESTAGWIAGCFNQSAVMLQVETLTTPARFIEQRKEAQEKTV